MRALVWQGPGKLEVIERSGPVAGPGEVLIRSVAVGLCGTDVHVYEGAFAPATPPLVLGHELTGLVAEVNSVESFPRLRAGDRVVVNPTIGCGSCPDCRNQRTNRCQARKAMGLAGWDGGLADYFLAPAANVHVMPDSVSWDDGACMDALANAVHGLDMVPTRPEETVAVFGCGASGLCFIRLCRLRGAARIIAVDVQEHRLEAATRFGADCVVNPRRDDAIETIRDLTAGLGADLTIEASGSTAAPPLCIAATATGGRVLIFGVYDRPVDGVDFQDQHRREITIFGSSGAPDTFPRAVELVATGAVPLGSMVSHRVRLEDVPGALAAKLVPETGQHLKTVVNIAGNLSV